MRLSKLQKQIIDSLNSPTEEGFFKKCVIELINETGAYQQNIDRSLKTMMANSLVKREKESGWKNKTDWRYAYYLPDNEEKNKKNKENRKQKRHREEAEAKEKGYDSVFDMWLKTKM